MSRSPTMETDRLLNGRRSIEVESTASDAGLDEFFDKAPLLRQRSKRTRSSSGHKTAVHENYEALDYEPCENELVREEERSYNFSCFSLLAWKRNRDRWIVSFLIGLCTALAGTLIQLLVAALSQRKYQFLGQMINYCDLNNCAQSPLLAWIIINVFFATIAVVLCVFIAPTAAGSGIPLIKCFLNGVRVPGILRLRTGIVKLIGLVCGVLGGLSIGKEGPMVHIGAVLAGGISQGRFLSFNLDFKLFEYFRSDKEKRDFVSAGAAAGVAAAFNAPIGGVLFAMEEGTSYWTQPITWRTFFCTMSCYFVLNLCLSAISGHIGFLSYFGVVNLGTVPDYRQNLIEIPIFILMGLFGGLNGALFCHINRKITIFRFNYLKTRMQKMFDVVLVASVSAVVCYNAIRLTNSCQLLSSTNVTKTFVQTNCETGYFNEIADMIMEVPEMAAERLFHAPAGTFHAFSLLWFCVAYWFLTVVTYGIHIPGGIFAPQLFIGACWGRVIGSTLTRLFPTHSHIFIPAKYAIIGSAAQMGGVLRMTISLCVIIMESVGSLSLGLALTLALLVAKFVGDKFDEGLLDMHIKLLECPVLPWEPPSQASVIPATTVMSAPVKVLPIRMRVFKLLRLLKSNAHNGYPVVSYPKKKSSSHKIDSFETYGRLEGIITRDQLIVILTRKAFTPRLFENSADGSLPWLSLADFRDPYPRYSASLDSLQFSRDELFQWIDLNPYMDPAPFCLREKASLRRLFLLFRQLGLRHCVIVNGENQVIGIVTRKDVARFQEEKVRNEKRYRIRELYINRSQSMSNNESA